jgi:bifunctional non-homologous end joining protein LigD
MPDDKKLSNPDKILFPVPGITKKEFADYYNRIWPVMSYYIKDRPVSLERFPDGIVGEGFYQKDTPEYYPEYIKRIPVESSDKIIKYALINNKKSINYIANMASIPIHTWQSRLKKLDYPDQVIWDLDPSDTDFNKIRIGARLLRYFLEELGVSPSIKLSGSKGVHLTVAVKPELGYTEIKRFSFGVAEFMSQQLPGLFTTELRKSRREGRIFIDWLRNQYGHTAAAPYSVRALPYAPVAAPVTWEELDNTEIHSQSFNIRNISDRIKSKGDIWKGFYEQAQSLKEPLKHLEELQRRKKFRSHIARQA